MFREFLFASLLLALSIGCAQNLPTEGKAKNSKKNELSEKLYEVGGYFVTEKSNISVDKIPIKAYELLKKELKGGTLVQAEHLGVRAIGFSGGGQVPGTSSDWIGFYVGKASGFNNEGGNLIPQVDPTIALRSFKVRAVVDYEDVYECYTKLATDIEVEVLRERGYIK